MARCLQSDRDDHVVAGALDTLAAVRARLELGETALRTARRNGLADTQGYISSRRQVTRRAVRKLHGAIGGHRRGGRAGLDAPSDYLLHCGIGRLRLSHHVDPPLQGCVVVRLVGVYPHPGELLFIAGVSTPLRPGPRHETSGASGGQSAAPHGQRGPPVGDVCVFSISSSASAARSSRNGGPGACHSAHSSFRTWSVTGESGVGEINSGAKHASKRPTGRPRAPCADL